MRNSHSDSTTWDKSHIRAKVGYNNRFDPIFSLVAGDGSAVKSKPSITPPTVRGAKLSNNTYSASATDQSSRWMRVRDKVKVRWKMTVDTVHSTLSLYKSKALKLKSVFSNELQSAKPQLRSLSKDKCHKYLPAQPRGELVKRRATADRERHRSLPPERQATANRERRRSLPPERQATANRERRRSLPPERRATANRERHRSLSPERRATANRERHRSLPPERRATANRERHRSLPPQRRVTACATACARWTPVPLLRNLPRVRCHRYRTTQLYSSIRRPATGPSWGSDTDRQRIALAIKQKAARDEHWRLIRSACDSEDHKEFSKDPEWRKELFRAHSNLLKACGSTREKLERATYIIRSMHPGRAQIDVNPTQVAIALQPAVEEGSVTQEQTDTMVKIATEGISVEEFRDLLGESTDLSAGNTEGPEDEEI